MAEHTNLKDSRADSSKFEDDIEQLKADFKKLSETIVDLGHDSVGTVQSEGAEWLGAIEGQVKKKPFLTLFGAFGLGLIISQLIARR